MYAAPKSLAPAIAVISTRKIVPVVNSPMRKSSSVRRPTTDESDVTRGTTWPPPADTADQRAGKAPDAGADGHLVSACLAVVRVSRSSASRPLRDRMCRHGNALSVLRRA